MRAPALTPTQARLIDVILDRVAAWAERTPTITQVTKGVITSVTAGAASDGTALAVVAWRGSDIAMPYLASYTPVAAHVVAVARTGSQMLILGRIVGTP